MKNQHWTYGFERLEVWKTSISLAQTMYQMSRKFPKDEVFGLTSQIKRSVTSVSANISEGSARLGNKDRARFYQIAYSSLMETINHLVLAKIFRYIDESDYLAARIEIDSVAAQLNALHKSQVGR